MKTLTYLAEGMRLDLWELVLHVIGIHSPNLIPRWSSEDFDDLHQLVDAGFAWEEWLPEHELGHHAAGGPDI